MLRLIRPSCIALLLLVGPLAARAGGCGAPSSVTPKMLSAMVDSLQALSRDYGEALATGGDYQHSRAVFDSALARLRVSAAATPPADLRAELRLATMPPAAGDTAGLRHDLATVEFFLGTYAQPYVRAIDSPRFEGLLGPSMAILDSESTQALAGGERRLANYQRKFGPQSVPLNPLEVGLYYAIFQRVPGFGPSAACGPGAWEVVASYSPVYATISNRSVATTSVFEGGLRHYLFGPAWGRGGLRGLLRPAYYSFGVAVSPELNQALASPLKGTERVGGFFAWGDLKLAYVGGSHPGLLVSRQLQVLRNVF